MPFFFGTRPAVPRRRHANECLDTVAMGVVATPLLLTATVAVSLFFTGRNIVVFAVFQALLLLAAFWTLWRVRVRGLALPDTVPAMSLLYYWGWLAVTLFWTPVPFVSVTMFWWLSSLPLAFWIYTLSPADERRWPLISALLLGTGLAAGGYGLYQFYLLDLVPRSVFLDSNILATLMYLLALPLCGRFLLLSGARRREPAKVWLAAAAYAALVYVLMLTRSRGGLLAFLTGTLLLLVVVRRHVGARQAGIVAGIVAAAYLLADLGWQGGLSDRAATLAEPVGAGGERFSIWRQSWRLLFEQSPQWGIGLGLYSLVWPPYREPTDTSGGFFVHNDYLQLWIEAGVPGLLLFLGFLGGVAWSGWRFLRRVRAPAVRIEAAALFAAFVAVSLHSLVQYNFYVAPLLLIVGLGVARLQELQAGQPAGTRTAWTLRPLRHVRTRTYALLLSLAALLSLGYFFSIGVSVYQSARAADLVAREQWEQAERALILAERWWSDADAPRLARADLYRQVMLRVEDETQKRALFRDAVNLLARAEARNPLRPNTYLLRADLYREARAFTGPAGDARAEADLRRALALDPRYYPARVRYALFLLERGREPEAAGVLEAGTHYRYLGSAGIVPYLDLTAQLRARRGDDEGAAELRRRIAALLEPAAGP